jgi:hypothetical protein
LSDEPNSAEYALEAISLLSAIVNDDRNAIKYLVNEENFDLSTGCIGMANIAAYLINVLSITVNRSVQEIILNMVYFFEMQKLSKEDS